MDDDPIETDDPLEQCQWLAEEKMRSITLEMRELQRRYNHCKRVLLQWEAHRSAIVRARETRVKVVPSSEDDLERESEAPTQIGVNIGSSLDRPRGCTRVT